MVSRTKETIFNSFFGIISSFVSLFSAYAVRIIISKFLGDEIYGVNSLFYSIVNTMLILELGISSAIVIFLYKPVASNDEEKIKSIVRFYRNIYRVFCLILLIGGLIVAFFLLDLLVHSDININLIRVYFLLYLFAIIFKYLLGYKKCLLYASQKNRIVTSITAICELIFSGLEILTIINFKNYVVFLILFIIQNVFCNIICNIYVNHRYPFIKDKKINKLSDDLRKSMINVCKPMFVQRISNQINNSSSSIILGSLASVVIVGFYSNYLIIVHAAQTVVSQISNSFTSSFGNYMVLDHSNLDKQNVYKTSRFGILLISLVGTSFFFAIVDFIILFLFGKNYILNLITVLLVSVYLFITLISNIDMSVQNSVGLHRLDAKEMVCQTISTILLSILFGYFWGINGILIGNIIPYFIFSYVIKDYKIKKEVFHFSLSEYLLDSVRELMCFFVSLIFVLFIKIILQKNNFDLLQGFFILAFSSLFGSLLIILLFYFKRLEFKNFFNKIKQSLFGKLS